MDIFKSFTTAMDRQIERKRFNFNLTTGEYNALSETEKSEWDRRLFDFWTVGHPDENPTLIAKRNEEDRLDLDENGFWS